jgi:acetoin utilization protein AcuB
MRSPVATIKPRDSVQLAREILERKRINQLPVVVRGRLVGIVTDRDLRDAFPSTLSILGRRTRRRRRFSPTMDKVAVEEVMTRNVQTAPPDASIADAARLIRRERIGAVPIVEKGKVVGILTRSDLLDACETLFERVLNGPQ